jgi:hypothetical protein
MFQRHLSLSSLLSSLNTVLPVLQWNGHK